MNQIHNEIAEQAHKDRNPVIEVCESLGRYIREFEASLNSDQEVGARLVTFGQAITFHINQVGFSQPNLVTFYGTTDSGELVQLIQHVSQLSVLLMAMKRVSEEPKRPIGFVWN
jgi:hypothetical protein